MAYSSTYDEKSTGYYPIYSYSYADAPNSIATSFTIAAGFFNGAKGFLNHSSLVADKDVYDMGFLTAGSYYVSASNSNWFYGSGSYSFYNPTVTIYNSLGNAVYGGSLSSSVSFNLSSSERYFLQVTGSPYISSQYDVYYTFTATANHPATADIAINGNLTLGSNLTVQGTVYDTEGVSSANYSYVWYTSSDSVNWGPVGYSSVYLIQAGDLGKTIDCLISFTDDQGNYENISPLAVYIPSNDTTPPTIAISSDYSALSLGYGATISFILSEDSTDFTIADVTVSGGELSNFRGSGNRYTAYFTPPTNSTTNGVVSVASNKFSDAAGNFNADGSDANGLDGNNIVTISVDSVRPTIAISTNDSALKLGDVATITFTLSEPSADFNFYVDNPWGSSVSYSGGRLSNFSGSGTTYTATFTPTASYRANGVVSVESSKFTDMANNFNVDGLDVNNTVTMTVDTAAPTIQITTNKSDLSEGEQCTIAFLLSEASTDFTSADVTVIGGELSNFGGSGVNYIAIFTPANNSSAGSVSVDAYTFTDAIGNSNSAASNTVTMTVDATPYVTSIVMDDMSLKVGDSSLVTIIFSEAVTGFTNADVSVQNGTISTLNSVDFGITWRGTFTPTSGITDSTNIITVAANYYDVVTGNSGPSFTSANYMVDTLSPAVSTFSPADNATGVAINSNIVVTFSEAIKFGTGNIVIHDGSASGTVIATYNVASPGSNLSISGSTLTINPTNDLVNGKNYYVTFASGAIKDIAGNSYAGTSTYDFTTMAAPSSNINGTNGNDTLTGTLGNDTIDGGSGNDVAKYQSSLSDYAITKSGSQYYVSGADGNDTLLNVEKLEFSDFSLNLTIQGTATSGVTADEVNKIAELYVAYFNRVPEADGLEYWINTYKNGVSMADISRTFYDVGIQYSELTGYTASMSLESFIDVIYQNVLGRDEVDAQGLDFWMTSITEGRQTRQDLVASILSAAHTFKLDPVWHHVPDLLDNKIEVANYFAVQNGLNYLSPEDSITQGMAMAAGITSTDTTTAIDLIGVHDIEIMVV